MKKITLKIARAIAADWHGGQRSGLYAFASSGQLLPEQELQCIAEIERDLTNAGIGRSQAKRLQQLKAYFETKKTKKHRNGHQSTKIQRSSITG